jgi:hypothetical protein
MAVRGQLVWMGKGAIVVRFKILSRYYLVGAEEYQEKRHSM